ncbi:hypothetical protein ACFL6E_04370 [Candidatus Neomarinimicrobiota bacterium]
MVNWGKAPSPNPSVDGFALSHICVVGSMVGEGKIHETHVDAAGALGTQSGHGNGSSV